MGFMEIMRSNWPVFVGVFIGNFIGTMFGLWLLGMV